MKRREGTDVPAGRHSTPATRDDHATPSAAPGQAEDSSWWYGTLFEQAPVAMVRTSTEGRFLRVNQRACAMFGYSRDELLTRTFFDLTHPLDIDVTRDLSRAVMLGAPPATSLEIRCVRKNESLLWVQFSVAVVRDDGQPLHVVAALHDITPSKRSEQRLALQSAIGHVLAAPPTPITNVLTVILATLGENLGWDAGRYWRIAEPGLTLDCAATWVTSHAAGEAHEAHAPRLNVTAVGTTFARGVGLPGRVWSTSQPVWITDLAAETSASREAAAVDADVRGAFAFPILGSAGVLGVVECFNTSPQAADDELLQTLWTIGSHIGQYLDRVGTEAALRQSEARKSAMLAAALDAIVTMDSAGLVTEFNPAAEQMFGWRADEIVGKPMADHIIPPSLRAFHNAGLANYLRTHVPHILDRRVDITALRKDGIEFPVELTVSRISAEGEPAFTAYVRDISERKRAEREERERIAHAGLAVDVGRALTSSAALPDKLQRCAEAVVAHLEAAFARVWTLNEAEQVLELRASAGMYTHLDGAHSRVPVGMYKIGLIAQERAPHLTNQAIGDERVNDQAWAEREGMVAFAGYPLMVGERVMGVLALFARHSLRPQSIEALSAVADEIALAIDQARLAEAERAALAEAGARASHLEATIEAITDAVFIYDATGAILHANAAAACMIRLDAMPEYIAKPLAERTRHVIMRGEHGETLDDPAWPQRRIMRGESISSEDFMLQSLEGHTVQVNLSGGPARDSSGALIGGVIIMRDVTERRRSERKTHEILTTLLAMAEALMIGPSTDRHERVQAFQDEQSSEPASASLTERTGAGQATPTQTAVLQVVSLTQRVLDAKYTGVLLVPIDTELLQPIAVVGLPAEMEQRWWRDLSNAPAHVYLPPEMLSRLVAGEALELDLSAHPPIPSQQYFGVQHLLIVPIPLDGGLLCVVTIERPQRAAFTTEERELAQAAARLVSLVIERERLVRERAQAEAQVLALSEANWRMDEFLGVAGHELRTPLTSIKAMTQMAERTVRDLAAMKTQHNPADLAARLHRADKQLQRADQQSNRLDRLVQDLLEVSRIQAGKLEMRMELCNLATIVAETVEEQRLANPERRIALELPINRHVPVVADGDRIAQVLANYLTNAVKYSPSATEIIVRVETGDGSVCVNVDDRGPGIPADERQRVWERFHRVPSAASDRQGNGGGLGLGLYICQTIIDRHEGRVGVKSTVGEGSTFSFTLPLADAD